MDFLGQLLPGQEMASGGMGAPTGQGNWAARSPYRLPHLPLTLPHLPLTGARSCGVSARSTGVKLEADRAGTASRQGARV